MIVFILVLLSLFLFSIFLRGMINYKKGVLLTTQPFNNWIELVQHSEPKKKEMLCHTLLLETGSLLEKNNLISQKNFHKLYEDNRVLYSNFVVYTILATSKFENLSMAQYEFEEARIYLYKCFFEIYKNGLALDGEQIFYVGSQAFGVVARACYDQDSHPLFNIK